MKWIILILLLGVIAICTWRGYKSGIIRGVCGILAIVIALYGANILAKMYNDEFDGMLNPFVTGLVDSSLDKVKNDSKESVVKISDADKKDVYSVSFAVSMQMGISKSASEIIAKETAEACSTVDADMNMFLTEILCVRLAYIAVFCVFFIIIAIIFSVIGNLISFSFEIPGIGIVEPIAGAILGLIKGILIAYALTMFLRYLGLVIPAEMLEGTKLVTKMINDNPVANTLGI